MLAIVIASSFLSQLIIACSKGGTSIEDLAEKFPDMIIKVLPFFSLMIVKSNFHFAAHSFFLLHIGYQVPVDVFHGITDKDAAKVVDGLGLKGADRNTSIEQVKKLYELFCKCDCTLLEVSMFPSLRCSRCNFHVAFLTNIDATYFISSIL